jgi:hypothetical protein
MDTIQVRRYPRKRSQGISPGFGTLVVDFLWTERAYALLRLRPLPDRGCMERLVYGGYGGFHG